MAILTGMVASSMVFSSFAAPKDERNNTYVKITVKDGWRMVGIYEGKSADNWTQQFVIWEKEGMCNAYYWVEKWGSDLKNQKNPDESESFVNKGILRQNSEKKWYAAYNGRNYFIDF